MHEILMNILSDTKLCAYVFLVVFIIAMVIINIAFVKYLKDNHYL